MLQWPPWDTVYRQAPFLQEVWHALYVAPVCRHRAVPGAGLGPNADSVRPRSSRCKNRKNYSASVTPPPTKAKLFDPTDNTVSFLEHGAPYYTRKGREIFWAAAFAAFSAGRKLKEELMASPADRGFFAGSSSFYSFQSEKSKIMHSTVRRLRGRRVSPTGEKILLEEKTVFESHRTAQLASILQHTALLLRENLCQPAHWTIIERNVDQLLGVLKNRCCRVDLYAGQRERDASLHEEDQSSSRTSEHLPTDSEDAVLHRRWKFVVGQVKLPPTQTSCVCASLDEQTVRDWFGGEQYAEGGPPPEMQPWWGDLDFPGDVHRAFYDTEFLFWGLGHQRAGGVSIELDRMVWTRTSKGVYRPLHAMKC